MNNTTNIEIERKWLLEGFPPLPVHRTAEMEQGYLCFLPTTVRIRHLTSNGKATYMLTIKGEGTLERTEVEFAITQAQYEALRGLLAAPPVHKEFRSYLLEDGSLLECSLVDKGQPGSFYYAEVEFASVEDAHAFTPPGFLGREVTHDPSFTMAAYCAKKYENCEE